MLTSVETLTKFSVKCQSKLEDCHVRLQRIEAALILVENKLGNYFPKKNYLEAKNIHSSPDLN